MDKVILHLLLIEYSKINFYKYTNCETILTDVAFIEISIDGAELYATCLIKKEYYYDKPIKDLDFSEILSVNKKIKISHVDVLESRIIIDSDVKEISSHRLLAAHDEKLYKSI